ncbi:MAG: PAS domain S-box protein [Syntrophaceae bacterium]
MEDEDKTKEQLIKELNETRQQIIELKEKDAVREVIEEALREIKERYRTLYHETPAMLHSIESNGVIVNVSNQWLNTLGYDRGEVIGRKLTEFLTEESRRYAEEVVIPNFLKNGCCKDIPYQFIKKNGDTMDVLLSASCERDTEGNVVRSLAVLLDVTDRKRTEEEQRHCEKNQNILEIAGAICHEMHQPMQVISGYTELLLMSFAEDDSIYAKLITIKNQIHRMSTITRKLMLLNKCESRNYIGLNKILNIHE